MIILRITANSWRIFYLLIFLLCALVSEAEAAKVFGRITDEDNNPLPFATLHIKSTSLGTTSNAEGYYSMELKPGVYELIIQFIGYRAYNAQVRVSETPVELNVVLKPEVFELKEVVVRANGEDPAYQIIRNAMKTRKEYLQEVDAYHCDVYIKGLQRLDEAPKSLLGIPINIDTGIVYLSESISKFSFKKPDHIKEEMISSKVSGSNKAFSYNQASEMMFSFYENLIQVEGLNERGFISPIASNAFSYYDYVLDGVFEENGYEVNRISVIPKRKNEPVFSGKIYIIEDSWRIHSLDFLLTKDNQIEFIDSLSINQVYAPIPTGNKGTPWMMISQQFSFQFKVFGFKGSGYFIGIHSNYEIEPDFGKKFFTHEIMSVKEESNLFKADYWDKVRPVPLTATEKKDYHEKDSLRILKESRPYLDSLDRKNNKIKPAHILFAGYTRKNSFKKNSLTFDPIITTLQFNTVEGFTPNLKINYIQDFENRDFYRITPVMRYGFANERLNAKVEALYYYNPYKFSYTSISGGRFVEQFNAEEPISPFINSLYTLLAERNYLKIYAKDFVQYRHRTELVNGLMFTGSLEYSQRSPLFNHTNYTFNNVAGREFTANEPININPESTGFLRHQALLANLSLRIRFAQKYVTRPFHKIIYDSKYPTLLLTYRKGLPGLFGSDVDFDKVLMNLVHDFNLKLYGTTNLSLTGGTFINTKKMFFMDFQHFSGNQTIFSQGENRFQLLDYYFYSTDNYWLEGHIEHHFNGFLFNKIPLVRKLKWQAVASANYLRTQDLPYYTEFAFGIEHLFKIGRIDYFFNFYPVNGTEQAQQISRNGIRLGIGF